MGAATTPSGAGWIRGLVVRGRGDFAAPSPAAEAFGLAARVVVAPATPEAVVLERVAAFLAVVLVRLAAVVVRLAEPETAFFALAMSAVTVLRALLAAFLALATVSLAVEAINIRLRGKAKAREAVKLRKEQI